MAKVELRSTNFDEGALDLELRRLSTDRTVTVQDAMGIPGLAGCVELISSVVAGLPVRLYQEDSGNIREITDDYRLRLLNDDPGDLLDAYQWKKTLVRDYLLPGNGYSFVNWIDRRIEGIYYLDPNQVSVSRNADPIFKRADFLIGGIVYRDWQVMRILRNTTDGATGTGVVQDSARALSVMVESMLYERSLVRSGARKGFLKSPKRLTEGALSSLAAAIKRLFSNEDENVVVLNGGLEYQAAGQSAVETQLNENKETNGRECCKLFCLSPKLFEGGATAEDRRISAANGIIPVVKALVSSLNRFCLLEDEKGRMYFDIDTDELLNGSLLERYQAYELAAKTGFIQLDEIRYREGMSPLGLNFVKLGLDTVLYDPNTGQIYTPNTDKVTKMTKSGLFAPEEGGNT